MREYGCDVELDGYVFKFPGQMLRFRTVMAESDRSGFATALDAVDALRAGWQPLSAELVVTCPDPECAEEGGAARPHWLLTRAAIPPAIIVQAMRIDPVHTAAENLCRPTLEGWLAASLADCGCEKRDRKPEWRELRFDASRAWMGSRDWRSSQDVVRLRTDAGTLAVPLERDEQGTWLSGPRDPAFDQAPLTVVLLQRWEALSLSIAVNVSYLLEHGEPAAGQFTSALSRLEAMGWKAG